MPPMSTLRADENLEGKNSFLGVPSQAGAGNPRHHSGNPPLTPPVAQSENSNGVQDWSMNPVAVEAGHVPEVPMVPQFELVKSQTEVSALKDAAVRLTKKLDAWRELGRQAGADMEYWFKLTGNEYPRRRVGEIKKAVLEAEKL